MENQSRPILVPTDFTVVAQYAVEAAVRFAQSMSTNIVLVHIIKKSSDLIGATQKVEAEAKSFAAEYGVRITGIVREGTIFTTIGKTVEELGALLVVMGTHGIKGRQKITGSWALKVIVSSKVPLIVVQGHTRSSVGRIVFSVDYKKENREKLGWTHYIAKLFDSNVYIFRDKPSKDRKIEQSIRSHLVFIEKFLNSKKIFFDVAVAEGKESFARETLNYAERIGADLIVITTTKGISFADYLFGTVEENFIDNEAKIPVMCINPKKAKFASGFSAMGGA
ncbi:MAG: universal stress protein [Bacteroidales bacterium]|jgi:nucleotide-binding universal stress UspA family protein|nr:universal stress protein [Bacteroidales bacterium]